MDNLEKYSEVTNLNFDKEAPHLAICHKSQGYSANLRPQALLFKSGDQIPTKEIIKSLEGVVSEKELTKMTYRNMKRSLEETIEKFLRENMSANGEYVWVEVIDFNDEFVAFYFQDTLWGVDYEATEDGIVTLGEDLRETSRREIYVDSESGEELIKSSFWKQEQNPQSKEELSSEENGEIEGEVQETDTQDTPVQTEEGKDMTDVVEKPEVGSEELLKSAAVQELLQKAVEDALAKKDAEIQKAAKDAQTAELVKGFAFVAEESVDELVKAITGSKDEIAAELVKAMSAAQEKIESLEAEVVKVKEEFGKQDSVQGEVEGKHSAAKVGRESELEKAVAAQLAKRNK